VAHGSFKQTIERRLRVTVSFGVASNKLISQIVSKLKKPRGLAIVESGAERRNFWPLSTSSGCQAWADARRAALKGSWLPPHRTSAGASQARLCSVSGRLRPQTPSSTPPASTNALSWSSGVRR
jgi:hypothetical protein